MDEQPPLQTEEPEAGQPSQPNPTFPKDVLFLVQARLPLRELYKSKRVSKAWKANAEKVIQQRIEAIRTITKEERDAKLLALGRMLGPIHPELFTDNGIIIALEEGLITHSELARFHMFPWFRQLTLSNHGLSALREKLIHFEAFSHRYHTVESFQLLLTDASGRDLLRTMTAVFNSIDGHRKQLGLPQRDRSNNNPSPLDQFEAELEYFYFTLADQFTEGANAPWGKKDIQKYSTAILKMAKSIFDPSSSLKQQQQTMAEAHRVITHFYLRLAVVALITLGAASAGFVLFGVLMGFYIGLATAVAWGGVLGGTTIPILFSGPLSAVEIREKQLMTAANSFSAFRHNIK